MSDPLKTRQLQSLGNTDATRVAIVGKSVFDPLLFARKMVSFSRRQYLFLNAYRLGTPLAEAAQKAGMTVSSAERFLNRPSTRAWMENRVSQDQIKQEWHETSKWWEMGHEVLEGKRHLSKDQQVVYLEFGKRVCPEIKSHPEANKGPTINFNFSAEAVKEAFDRQNVIDAEVSK